MVDSGRAAAEDSISKGMPFADCHRREIDPVRDIANGMNVRQRGLRKSVNLDGTRLAEPHSRCFKPEPGDIRMAADGKHHLVHFDVIAVSQPGAECAAGRLYSRDGSAADDANAPALHLRMQVRTHIIIEAAQHLRAAIYQRDIAAQSIEDAGEFESDITAALNEDALRQLFEMECLVRGDDV